MIITIAFLACAVACASMFRHTDRLNEKFGFIIHWLVTIAGVASAALGGVHAGHPVSPTVARVSLVAFAAVLALGVAVFTGWRGKGFGPQPIAWFKFIALAAATFAVYAAAAQ
jgi:uncharacterized membrane protein YoaK (UPF0700 family)